MAKKRTTRRASRRTARQEIKREINKSLSKQDREDLQKLKCHVKQGAQGTGGAFYFLAFIGALVYYISTATSLWDAFIGFFQALLWPAFLVFGLLQQLGA